jgi:hypothetical protein
LLAELSRSDRVTVLKDMVQRSSYHVDPQVVAVAIIERVRPPDLLAELDALAELPARRPRRAD